MLEMVTGRQAALELRIAALERVEVTSVPIVNIVSRGALSDGSDARSVIQDALEIAEAAGGPVTVLLPSGPYDITSLVGSGRSTYSLKISTGTVNIVGMPGAQLRFGNGSAIRPFIVRAAATVEIFNVEILYTRTDGAAAVGLSLENSSRIKVDSCLFEDWTFYGIGVSEDTSAPQVQASTISFDAASHQIRDSANGFTEFTTLWPVTVGGSLSNDGRYTPTSVDPAGAYVVVSETLVNEAAGASSVAVIRSDFTFNAADRTISSPTANLLRFPEQSQVHVTGSGSNDGFYTIVDVSATGDTISVAEALVNEAPGATVTLTKVGKPTVGMQVATACNTIRILRCTFNRIGLYAVETFPKVQSHDLLVAYNTFYDCGYITGTGAAIKAGQTYTSALVALNQIAHCVMGIIAGQWEELHITTNSILNCYAFGVAISAGNHAKGIAKHRSLLIDNNQIGYVDDYISGVLFSPSNPNTIDPARRTFSRSYGAINVNGLMDALVGPTWSNGPIVIARNKITKWGSGLSFYKSLMPIPNVHLIENELVDCGGTLVSPVTATGVVTAGSAVITNVVTDGFAGVAGWAKNVPIRADTTYFPVTTTIVDIDPNLATITVSTPALAGAPTTIGLRSAFPAGLRTSGNRFSQTLVDATGVVTAGLNVISSVITGNRAGTGGWEVGMTLAVDSAFFAAGTTVTAVDPVLKTLTVSNVALSGAATTIVLGNAGVSLVQWYSENGEHIGNQFDGYAPFALQIKGDGTSLYSNIFRHVNRQNTASRSPILFNERGTYTAIGNVLDVGGTIATGFASTMFIGAIAPGSAGIGGSVTLALDDNVSTLSSVISTSGLTVATTLPAHYHAGLRTVYGTAAPTTGAWGAGEKCINLTPTPFIAIDHWYNVAGGSPGTWRAVGLGQGTTAQLPGTLVAGDAGYIFECTDTGIFKYWDGVAWDDLTGPAAPAAIAAATFITQTPSSLLSAEQALSALATGYMKSTTTTGVVSTQAIPIPVADGGTGAGAFTAGSAVFAGAAGVYTEDNANYFWDNTNKRLGIGTAAPAVPLDINTQDAGTATTVDGFITRHRSTGAPGTNFGGVWRMQAETSNNTNANQFNVTGLWATATNGSQKAQVKFFVYDTAAREAIRIEASGTAPMIGVLGAAASARINVTGSRGGNAALASLLTALATFGWITDSTTA